MSITVPLQRKTTPPWSAGARLMGVLGVAFGLLGSVWAQPSGAQGAPVAATAAAPTPPGRALETALQAQRAGQPEAALASVDEALRSHPHDVRLRFLRGVLLSQLSRADEAEAVFQDLTQAFPELAEPYNNLAVLRAGRGDLDGARAALEAALRASPDYATAHENLGDLALQKALQAYQRAQQLDPQRSSLAHKLNRLKHLLKAADPAAPLSFTPRPGAQPQAKPE